MDTALLLDSMFQIGRKERIRIKKDHLNTSSSDPFQVPHMKRIIWSRLVGGYRNNSILWDSWQVVVGTSMVCHQLVGPYNKYFGEDFLISSGRCSFQVVNEKLFG